MSRNTRIHSGGRQRQRRSIGGILFTLVLLASLGLPAAGPGAPRVLAQTNTLALNVISARTEPRAFGGAGVTKGDPITQFKYIINVDNTGQTTQRLDPTTGDLPFACTPADPTYPDNCLWTSIAGVPGSSPIVTQGDQADFGPGITLPDGRYLISVLADGYRIDGAHFTVPLDGPVTVEMQPTPLPAATIQAEIFEDISPTNSGPDVPAEHGLAGFLGNIADYLGMVTTDVFGNPLCTEYERDANGNIILDADNNPTPIPGSGEVCVSKCYVVNGGVDLGWVDPIDAEGRCPDVSGVTTAHPFPWVPAIDPGLTVEGKLIIPNLGPNRYALSATPPDGSPWIQTTTLEGNHDWDAWVMEGATGLDTEFVVAGEPFPAIFFGYVYPTPMPASTASGEIKGVIAAAKAYVPPKGGVPLPNQGFSGLRIDKPIDSPWISLVDLTNGDTAIYVGQGNSDGSFDIQNVPDGNYSLVWWDEPQDYILDLMNVTVSNGEVVDLGVLPLLGWWTQLEGYVFEDLNRNGVMDPGERALPNFTLTMRKRENSLMDRGATLVTTDASGYYYMENAYPMTQWLVEEAYNDLYYTTGVTYQADNQPEPTTVLGSGVDVSVLPIIGLSGRLDWGVHAYDASGSNGVDPQNGGIVGTVSYDTTRNELDPRYAVAEDWQPGIPNLNVNLYAPVPCHTTGAPCDVTGRYELASDGSYAKGQLLNVYVTENWERPTGCVARDVDGNPLLYPTDQQVLPYDPADPTTQNQAAGCLEGPLMGVQYQTGFSTVDGNFGFGDGCFGPGGASGPETCADGSQPVLLPGGRDYLVEVEIPNDPILGRPMYKVTKEEDINIGNGDQFVPQVPPPACAGSLHTVDVAGIGTDNYPAQTLPNGITVPASTPIDNSTFVDIGGSPYEGSVRPLCNVKLVELNNGKSIVPLFHLFTDVPIPGRFWGLLVDDLNFSSDPRSLLYGEKAGVPFAPVGIYDYTDRLVATVESDFNGLFDVLLPSTNRISCPTPSGVCANLYRFVGNDPGIPGQLNPNYNPNFRTIAAEFEAFPGLLVPADLAPTQVGVTVQLPGGQVNSAAVCAPDPATPQLFAVSQPYHDVDTGPGAFSITGVAFGASPGQVTLDDTIALPTTSWSDTAIAVTVPANTPLGPHQLKITTAGGQSTVNGLTFHVLGEAPFPLAPVLDTFNRPNGPLGPNWSGNTALAVARINGGNVQVRSNANLWWNPSVFGADQEAYLTFVQTSATATEQALLLKFNGTTPNASSASWIEVSYTSTDNRIRVRAKRPATPGLPTIVTHANFGATFAPGDQLGARAQANGMVYVYKNGVLIGSADVTGGANPWPANLVGGGGWIGVRFVGTTVTDFARFDDFGGGTVSPGYRPNLYEVGPGLTGPNQFDPAAYTYPIQSALDAAATSPGDDLVVVYPGLPDLTNPRLNPRGAYYENLIMYSPVKLQGVGPGGFQGTTFVPGSIIDGGAYGGDTQLALDWLTKIAGLTWVGNQNINDGQAIYVLAQSETQYTANFRASIDGFDIRGGDQMGFPTNINEIGGLPTGLPAAIVTQGGAIFANAYARYLQISNNVVENNGGGYGTIRIGTPDLAEPDTNQHNENVLIAHNRVIANAGTNLAGGVGLFAGSDNYEVAYNDICGNFSAEYGGGLSVYGLSPNGAIHDNRVYFNRSYDEGGGIIIAGQLPADPTTLSPGSGAVDIYNNLIQANLGNDDGGGIRFLMAGNFPMNVYNNMIVNNVSTHEGGGISLNDAPDVRIYNNTIMKNITTATAVTSSGFPAPAGLSSSANSIQLQATLPAGAPVFSNPLLFNNIFWDNRAGTRGLTTVTGIGQTGDPTPINYWDLGVADGSGLLAPTNSIVQQNQAVYPIVPSGTNLATDPAVVAMYDLSVTFNSWRTNPNFIGAILVAVDLPTQLTSDYHLTAGSPAVDTGAASKTIGALTVNAPAFDIDMDARPSGGGFEIGADELP